MCSSFDWYRYTARDILSPEDKRKKLKCQMKFENGVQYPKRLLDLEQLVIFIIIIIKTILCPEKIFDEES